MLYAVLTSILLASPLAAATVQAHNTTAEQTKHKEITAEQLKSYYDQKKPMIVLDARSKKFMDGHVLPNAKSVPYDSSDKTIQAAAPSKDGLIVVYCASAQCPLAGMLYNKLISLNYSNVLEYHGGINDWNAKHYPTDKI